MDLVQLILDGEATWRSGFIIMTFMGVMIILAETFIHTKARGEHLMVAWRIIRQNRIWPFLLALLLLGGELLGTGFPLWAVAVVFSLWGIYQWVRARNERFYGQGTYVGMRRKS